MATVAPASHGDDSAVERFRAVVEKALTEAPNRQAALEHIVELLEANRKGASRNHAATLGAPCYPWCEDRGPEHSRDDEHHSPEHRLTGTDANPQNIAAALLHMETGTAPKVHVDPLSGSATMNAPEARAFADRVELWAANIRKLADDCEASPIRECREYDWCDNEGEHGFHQSRTMGHGPDALASVQLILDEQDPAASARFFIASTVGGQGNPEDISPERLKIQIACLRDYVKELDHFLFDAIEIRRELGLAPEGTQ